MSARAREPRMRTVEGMGRSLAMPAIAVFTTAAALAVGGCGSDSNAGDGTDSAPTSTRTATPTPADDGSFATADPSSPTTGDTSPDAGATQPSGATTATASSRCTAQSLRGSLTFGPGAGSAGSTTGTLALRNTGDAACTLLGYPGVSLVDASGHQLGAAATRAGESANGVQPRTVTIDPGATAETTLQIADVGNYSANDCDPTDATGLRVYPPGSRAALFIAHSLRGCTKDVHVLTVGPLAPKG